MSEKQKFVVDRRTWARGGKNGPAALLNNRDFMCCLGFVCEQCGVAKDAMRFVPNPWQVPESERKHVGFLWTFSLGNGSNNSPLSFRAACINDDISLRDDEREARLAKLFADAGFEMVFEN